MVTFENPGYIEPDKAQKIVQRQGFTTKPGGQGIGMRIIYDVLDMYHGTLKLESDEQRKITTFTICLPYKNKP